MCIVWSWLCSHSNVLLLLRAFRMEKRKATFCPVMVGNHGPFATLPGEQELACSSSAHGCRANSGSTEWEREGDLAAGT